MKTKPCRHCGEEVPASMSSCPSCGGSHTTDPALAFSVWLDDVLLRLRPHWKKILVALPLAFFLSVHGYTLTRYQTTNIYRAAAIKAMERAAAETGMDFMQERGQNAFSHALGEYVLAQVQDAIHKRGAVFAYRIVLGLHSMDEMKSGKGA